MAAANAPFSPDDSRTLELINLSVSTLSFLGSGATCILWFLFRKDALSGFAFRLVFFVAISDFFYSIGNLLGDAGGNSGTHLGANEHLCRTQAMMLSYFGLSSILWSVSIAFTLDRAFLQERREYGAARIGQFETRYHVVCWGIPLVMTLLPLTTDSYGDTGGWCWIIDQESVDEWWRMLQFYLPVWIAIGYNGIVFVRVRRKLAAITRSAKAAGAADSLRALRSSLISRIQYYPLVQIVCNMPATINDLHSLFTRHNTFVLWLNAVHVCFASIQGFLNFCVFISTPIVREAVGNRFHCGPCHPFFDRVSGGSFRLKDGQDNSRRVVSATDPPSSPGSDLDESMEMEVPEFSTGGVELDVVGESDD